ncbi:MAG: hypothetical protein R5N75_08290 [Cutibacterium granulosum]|uniref:hypothetical protein n=1 Tax=Cutibacterium granulosum TaxID=33011 RepID=UPI002B230FCC|nr:hypothetical protein [Cutibacterium granulosum]MEA5660089.1 hypothetical protein [Cutibacterium granulosum]
MPQFDPFHRNPDHPAGAGLSNTGNPQQPRPASSAPAAPASKPENAPQNEPGKKPEAESKSEESKADKPAPKKKSHHRNPNNPPRRNNRSRRGGANRGARRNPFDAGVPWDIFDDVVKARVAIDDLKDYDQKLFFHAFGFSKPDEEHRPTDVLRAYLPERQSHHKALTYAAGLMEDVWGGKLDDLMTVVTTGQKFAELSDDERSGVVTFVNGLFHDKLDKPAVDASEKDSLSIFTQMVQSMTQLRHSDEAHTDYLRGVLATFRTIDSLLAED